MKNQLKPITRMELIELQLSLAKKIKEVREELMNDDNVSEEKINTAEIKINKLIESRLKNILSLDDHHSFKNN